MAWRSSWSATRPSTRGNATRTTGAPFDQHPNGIAVEPMTAPANAFRSGDHLTVIEPGKSVTTVVRYEVTVK